MPLQALRDWTQQHEVRLKDDPTTETWLTHWNKPLLELPELIGLMRALTTIDLRKNGLRRLPESLGQLHRLESLTSMDNELESLPDVFHHLQHLFYLDLRENGLRSLPPSIGALESLKNLVLRDNCLSTLPDEIGQLKRLQRLDLSRNPLTSLPAALRHCESLEHLDISGTLIGHLPEWLGEMKALKQLTRSVNRAAEISRSLPWESKHPYIPSPGIDNEPFLLWFERNLADDPYGPMKITFRHILQQDLSDDEIASKARGMVGSEDWPQGWFVWGEDAAGEYIEYYLTSHWGDRRGRIGRDGSHTHLPALWQLGPIDDEYGTLQRELAAKGLID